MKTITLGIAGSASGSGKTTLACALLKKLSGKWGAIKYTRTPLYSSITDDLAVLSQKGKDTAKLLEAGACKALWIRSPREGLKGLVEEAIRDITSEPDIEGVIIEGGGAIEVFRPNIVIFILNDNKARKPGSEAIMRMADMVIKAGESERQTAGIIKMIDAIRDMREDLVKELKDASASGKLTCETAREIAARLGMRPEEVGKAADQLKIKITDCKLGCF